MTDTVVHKIHTASDLTCLIVWTGRSATIQILYNCKPKSVLWIKVKDTVEVYTEGVCFSLQIRKATLGKCQLNWGLWKLTLCVCVQCVVEVGFEEWSRQRHHYVLWLWAEHIQRTEKREVWLKWRGKGGTRQGWRSGLASNHVGLADHI